MGVATRKRKRERSNGDIEVETIVDYSNFEVYGSNSTAGSGKVSSLNIQGSTHHRKFQNEWCRDRRATEGWHQEFVYSVLTVVKWLDFPKLKQVGNVSKNPKILH